MILKLSGDINRYYVQTLCMVFFPGATFGENELPASGVPEVSVDVYYDEEGNCIANCSMKLNDRLCSSSAKVMSNEITHIATKPSVAVGRAMFEAGKQLLGHIPPWGILTGVRPAKMASKLLLNGLGVMKSKRVLRDEYFLNAQKASLAVSVANTEMKLLKKMDKNTCSLYISIPFCPTRCSYCSFVAYTTPKLLSLIDEYIDALIEELDEKIEVINRLGLTLSTVYIGGGTPTTLDPIQLNKLLEAVSSKVDVSTLSEFTLEAGRPDTITSEKLAVAKKYGVTRISVNPQTLNDDILKDIGRKHSSEDFFKAYEIAKNSGIRDINVDLIAGLPGDDFKSFSETVDGILSLAPTNITVHTFCVKKASDALKNNSEIYSLTGGDAAKCVFYSQLQTKLAGYKPYYMYRQKNTVGNLENVGYAQEGHEGLYNIYMMEEVHSIFAIGAGAVSKLVDYDRKNEGNTRIERVFNPKYPYEYLRAMKEKKDGTSDKASLIDTALKFFNIQ